METGPQAGMDGRFVAALRVDASVDGATFKARVDGAIRQIHDCRPAPGFARVYAPGEKEMLTQETYRQTGLPLDEPTRSGLAEAARRIGLGPEALRPLGEH